MRPRYCFFRLLDQSLSIFYFSDMGGTGKQFPVFGFDFSGNDSRSGSFRAENNYLCPFSGESKRIARPMPTTSRR